MVKIMVVDDEKEIRDLIKSALTSEEVSVLTASSGEEALVTAKAERPDLILLDIAMPGLDGYSTCEKLKQDSKTSAVPVLFLTGKDLEAQGIIQRSQDLGAVGYVSKLYPLKELARKVKEILSGP